MRDKVQAVLDKIRPSLQADGGDVELVDVSADNVVTVKLTRLCRMSHVPTNLKGRH